MPENRKKLSRPWGWILGIALLACAVGLALWYDRFTLVGHDDHLCDFRVQYQFIDAITSEPVPNAVLVLEDLSCSIDDSSGTEGSPGGRMYLEQPWFFNCRIFVSEKRGGLRLSKTTDFLFPTWKYRAFGGTHYEDIERTEMTPELYLKDVKQIDKEKFSLVVIIKLKKNKP